MRMPSQATVQTMILALFFSLAAQIAAGGIIAREMVDGGQNPFQSTDVLRSVISVATAISAILLALFQAFVLRLIVSLLRPDPKNPLTLGRSIRWVFLAQLPFIVVVLATWVFDWTTMMEVVRDTPFRVTNSVLIAVIYSLLVLRAKMLPPVRVLLVFLLITAINTALVLVSG